jgi:hypothetical protein
MLSKLKPLVNIMGANYHDVRHIVDVTLPLLPRFLLSVQLQTAAKAWHGMEFQRDHAQCIYGEVATLPRAFWYFEAKLAGVSWFHPQCAFAPAGTVRPPGFGS